LALQASLLVRAGGGLASRRGLPERSVGFALEAFQGYGGSLRVVLSCTQHLLGQELEGDKRAEAERFSALCTTPHAAATELLQNAVMADSAADHGRNPTYGSNVRPRVQTSQRSAESYISVKA
jgi:hypothetical protein